MRISAGTTPGAARIDLETGERRLLRGLFADTVSLLEGQTGEESDRAAGTGDDGDDIDPHADTAADDSEPAARGLGAEFEAMMAPGPDAAPDDPALQRLLPDVDSDDANRSAEFRRYTEPDLRAAKLSNLRTGLVTLERSGRLSLSPDEARAWLIALGDVRLVMASRMGIETDDDMERLETVADELPESEQMYISVYDFLTWAQERLVGALMGESEAEGPRTTDDPDGRGR